MILIDFGSVLSKCESYDMFHIEFDHDHVCDVQEIVSAHHFELFLVSHLFDLVFEDAVLSLDPRDTSQCFSISEFALMRIRWFPGLQIRCLQ